MKLLKTILIVLISVNLAGLIGLIIVFFSKFHNGFTNEPDQYYSAGNFVVGFLSLLVTSMIAIYINEITKQSSRFPEQRKIYKEVLSIMEYFREIYHANLTYMEYQIQVDSLTRSLNKLKGESFVFNDHELFENALIRYRDKLDEIGQVVSKAFHDNSDKFKGDNYKRLGGIRLLEIDENIFREVKISDEENFLKKSVIKAMK